MKKKSVKNLIILLVIILSGSMLSGCEKEKAEVVEITLLHGWGAMEPEHMAMRKIYEDFENENPNIHINLLSMPSPEDVVNKAGDMISVGNVPDIIFTGGIGYDTIYRFMVEKGYAVDLLPYIESDAEFKDNIETSIIDYWKTKDGKLFTLSDVLLMSGYWYNADIFSKAGIERDPKTWEEFLEVCNKISQWAEENDKDIMPISFDLENSIALFDYLVASDREELQGENNEWKLQLSDTEFLNNIEKLQTIFQYSYNLNKEFTYRDSMSYFNNENSAIYINGVWANYMIDQNINVKYAAFPTELGKSVACKSSCVGYIVGDTKDHRRINASISLLKYMLSDETQKRITEETGQVPINPSINIEDYKESMPRLYQAVNVVQNADKHIPVPVNLWIEKEKEYFQTNILDVLEGTLDINEFIKNIKSQ